MWNAEHKNEGRQPSSEQLLATRGLLNKKRWLVGDVSDTLTIFLDHRYEVSKFYQELDFSSDFVIKKPYKYLEIAFKPKILSKISIFPDFSLLVRVGLMPKYNIL